jgi:ATP-binding cassette subfamily B protein
MRMSARNSGPPKEDTNMLKTIRRVIRWCGPRKKRLYKGFVYSFFHSVFIGMPIMALAEVLRRVLLAQQGEQPMGQAWIGLTALMMLVAVFGRFLFSWLRAINQDSIAYEQTADVRLSIGEVMKHVPLGFFDKHDVGAMTTAITSDMSYLEMYTMRMIDIVVNGYITTAVFIVSIAFFSPPTALIALGGVGLSLLALSGLGRKSRANAPVHARSQEAMIRAVLEYIRAIPLIKSFKRQGVAVQGVEAAFAESKRINIKIELDYVIRNCLHLLALRLASAAMVLYASLAALNGMMPLSVMLMILVFSFVIFGHAEAVNNAAHVLNMIDTTMDQVEAIEQAQFIDEHGIAARLEGTDIRFDRVSFGFDQRTVIRDVSFTVPEGSTTAIVGPSGSGKTTLCNLLARFYDVDAGQITLGGRDIASLSLDSLLGNLSMVFQQVYLFNDTILSNIRFGNPAATREQVEQAARAACCHSMIQALPQGYDTMVGEGGQTLSGGEKQRISIARAILKNAPIILLDEATASIDPENEHLIQQAISALAKGKTMIIIAHRLATIRHADQILVMEDGRIAQRGTHETLMQEEGLYKRFVKLRERAEGWSIA